MRKVDPPPSEFPPPLLSSRNKEGREGLEEKGGVWKRGGFSRVPATHTHTHTVSR